MYPNQIADCLKTMSRSELRAVAKHLNVNRGKDKTDTVGNLTHAIHTGRARFKIAFTIKAHPANGQKHGGQVVHQGKIRTYGQPKTLWHLPKVIASSPRIAALQAPLRAA